MRAAVAIARREILSRRFVVLLGLALGVLPLLLSVLSPWPGISPVEIRTGASLLLSAVVATGAAIMTGSSVFGSDLAEKRMGFYFSRPVRTVSIWAGKLVGGLLVVELTVLAAFVPSWLMGISLTEHWPIPALLGLPGLVFLISNALATTIRSRSRWIALDFGAGLATAALIWVSVRRTSLQLLGAGSLGHDRVATILTVAAVVTVAVLLFALLFGSFLSTAAGRVDLARAHRFHSLGFWGVLLGFFVAANFYTLWLVSATPQELSAYWVRSGKTGTWVWVTGSLPGHRSFVPHTFLIELESGRSLEIKPALFPWTGGTALSSDGTKAAWVSLDPFSQRVSLVVADLHSRDPLQDALRLPLSGFPSRLVLSADGSRIALNIGHLIEVLEARDGKLLGSFQSPLSTRSAYRMHFTQDGRLRLCGQRSEPRTTPDSSVGIFEFDLSTRTVREVASLERAESREIAVLISPDGSHLIRKVTLADRFEISLHETATGRFVRTVAEGSGRPPRINWLSGNRLALLQKGAGGFQVLSLDSGPERMIQFPEGLRPLAVGVEPVAGMVLCSWMQPKEGSFVPEAVGTFRVDLESGNIQHLSFPGLPPEALPALQFQEEPVATGSPATRLLQARSGALVLLDPTFQAAREICRGAGKGAR